MKSIKVFPTNFITDDGKNILLITLASESKWRMYTVDNNGIVKLYNNTAYGNVAILIAAMNNLKMKQDRHET